ncbi:MAG: single-stranded DNA-binding protein [Streptococcaceae bacterium]|jgi:single-strand DNA-binding protein|nr:single-stranded DNA-binding protein [Streptococcaceae bacterium]
MINRVILTGRLTKDPEIKTIPSGKVVARFKLAVDRKFKNSEGKKQTDFLDVTIWGKSAETLVSYAGKGSMLAVEGELRSRNYEDANGKRHFLTEIICTAFSFLESKAIRELREKSNQPADSDPLDLAEEELPF